MRFLAGLALVIAMLAAQPAIAMSEVVMTTNQLRAAKVIQSLGNGQEPSLEGVDAEKFVLHDDTGDGGVEKLRSRSIDLQAGNIQIIRIFEDGDYVFAHSIYDRPDPQVGFDIFRFENGMLVEQWSVSQPRVGTNEAGYTQIDGPTVAVDRDKTEANKALIAIALDKIMVRKNNNLDWVDYVEQRMVSHASGSFEGFQSTLILDGPPLYKNVQMVLGEGDFVMSLSQGRKGEKHYDLFRVKDDKIVEYWTVTPKR